MIGYFDGKYAVQRELDIFLQEYEFEKIQFIGACGFESRTPVVLERLANGVHVSAKVECTIVDLLNKRDPSFSIARRLQSAHMLKLKRIASGRNWKLRHIVADLYSPRLRAHQPLLNTLRSILYRFSGDFLIDISAFPRSIFFPALKMLWETHRSRNLFVVYTEDPTVGALEKQAKKFRKPSFIPFFAPSSLTDSLVWLPILGGDNRPIRIIQKYYPFNDIYPVVGFPSTNPIETDEIVRRNRNIVYDRSEKIIFGSMNDPFQLSMKLNSTIDDIKSSLGDGVTVILSPHGSKPQSIGVFMTAVTRRASVLYCQPYSYYSKRGGTGKSYLYWLKGAAYGS